MATITSAQSGNFSATSTWVGGVVPGPADIAVAATSHVVSIDTDVTVTEFRQAGTGYFLVDTARIITGQITGNQGTTNGTVLITSPSTATVNGNITNPTTTSGIFGLVVNTSGTVTINSSSISGGGNGGGAVNQLGGSTVNLIGNITGGGSFGNSYVVASSTLNMTGNIGGGAANSSNLRINPSSTVNITGSISGQSGGTTPSVYVDTGITLNVIGSVTGGGPSVSGISLAVSGSTATVTGSVSGAAAGGTGISVTSASDLTIVGNVTASTGNPGVTSTSTTNYVTIAGDMTGSPNGMFAVYTRLLRVTPTLNSRTVYYDASAPTGASVVRASLDVAGDHPLPANVRQGTSYAYNQFTGTLAMPAANVVRNGVAVGNTTGTGAVTLTDIASVVGAQIAAGVST